MGVTNKEWLDRKSKKLSKKKSRDKNNVTMSRFGSRTIEKGFNHTEIIGYEEKAPEVFSFLNNTGPTVEFFLGYIKEMMRGIYREKFFFDSTGVQEVTLDALAYIIALSKNMLKKKINCFTISGNMPLQENPRETYIESGFLNFFRSKTNQLPPNTKRFKLVSGNRSRGEISKEICDFVISSLNKDRIYTQNLQNNLIEMMLNASVHAYVGDEIMQPTWYCCSEYSDNRVRIAFLDTGMGIANTVRKNFFEKSRLFTNDADLMYSAFNGDFRTTTEEDHRGNGLPSIRDSALSGYYDRFMVLSGGGCCMIVNDYDKLKLTKLNIQHRIYGTIYIFDIKA